MKAEQVLIQVEKACARIAPAWPLENSVAVNPFLGLSDMSFEKASSLLNNRANINLFMPLEFYTQFIDSGEISDHDIKKALSKRKIKLSPEDFLQQIKSTEKTYSSKQNLRTFIDFYDEKYWKNITEIMINHSSEWLSSYFSDYDNV